MMNRHVYNASLASGIVLTSVGAGMVYLPAGFIVAGVLVISAAVFGMLVSRAR